MIKRYCTRSEKDGKFYNIFPSLVQIKMCVKKDEQIWKIEMVEDSANGDYWSWQDTGSDDYTMIFPHRLLFNICFAYGPQAEIDKGRGRIAKLKVINSELFNGEI